MKTHKLNINDLLEVSTEDQTLSIHNDRILIFDSAALGILRKELMELFGEFGARNVLTRFGYAHGWRVAQTLQNSNLPLLDGLNGGASMHLLFGLVNTTDIKEIPAPSGNPYVDSTLESSYEAEQHLLHFGKSEEGVCWTLTGFASGYESYKQGKEVYFIEDKCCGKGDTVCHMQGRSREQWGDEINAHLPFYGIASENAVLKDITEKLQQVKRKLNNCQHSMGIDDICDSETGSIIVRSKQMQRVMELAKRTAKVDSSVIIMGESGAGKEVIARHIHNRSRRSAKPFITVNCGAFTETLLESELFGHAKGAFTGASRDRPGLFEEANSGTIFLDEIGETSPTMQVKLLRVLQEREVRRIGENTSRPIDVRVIAATNRNLAEEIEKGTFRKDLYYRLHVIELLLPPLSQRSEDILPLAHVFLKKAANEMDINVTGLSSEAAKQLLGYNWPGNVRELQNAIERSVAFSSQPLIQKEDLPPEIQSAQALPVLTNEIEPLEQVEQNYILAAIKATNGDKRAAAKQLGIGLSTLYRKLKMPV